MIGMTLENPNDILQQCIPYGFSKDPRILCKGDDTAQTRTLDYTIYGGIDYEYLISLGSYTPVTLGTLEDKCPPVRAAQLAPLTEGRRSESVLLPDALLMESETLPRTPAEAALLSACGYSDFVREHYLTVPESTDMISIRSQYVDLLDRYHPETATPPETILELQLLRERLCDQVTYSLSPGKTPSTRDFLSYFLLENKEGYCTHYATAAVILARMAGIPARYCEGYMIDNLLEQSEDGYTTEILDSNAHAWCEVWIEGIGWIPFEATYSYFTPPVFEYQAPTDPPPVETVPAPTQASSPKQESPTQAVQAPTSTEPPATEPVVEPSGNSLAFPLILAVLLAAAGIVFCFIAVRRIVLHRRIMALRNPKTAGSAAWHWFLLLLKECGADTSVTTAADLAEEARSACGSYLSGERIDAAHEIGTRLRYSPHALSSSDCKMLIRTCRSLTARYYAASNPIRKFYLKWIRHYL